MGRNEVEISRRGRTMIGNQMTLGDVGFNSIKWDSYYMAMCFLVASKSKDPSTKCGAVIVDKNNKVLSIGYNGPISGFPDDDVIIERPDKYNWFIHAEENALLSYNGSRSDMKDSTIYVTGRPCTRCLRGIIQSGITRIVWQKGRQIALWEHDFGAMAAWFAMVEHSGINVVEKDFEYDIINVFSNGLEVFENIKEK
jgi:dCMP deaminase